MSRFSDKDFPPDKSSLGSDELMKNLDWKRPKDFAEKPALFIDGSEAGDVIQGELGDCWFLGALSVLANREDLLKRCVVSSDLETGKHVFRFCKFGEWKEIEIDDQVPVHSSQGVPKFASSLDLNEAWTYLFEKAYAKLHGTYNDLVGGFVTDALSDLTGGIGLTIQFDKITEDVESGKLWDDLLEMHNSGMALLGCAAASGSSEREVDAGMGILMGHAYGILEVREYNGNRLLCIRNPWGCTEWKGDWSDVDDRWTDAMLKDLDHKKGDDGTFWMCYEDFIKHYTKIYVCYVFTKKWTKHTMRDEWKGSSAGGCANHKTWVNNPQFFVSSNSSESVRCIISLQQPDSRYVHQEGHYIGMAGFDVDDPTRLVRRYRPSHQTTVTNLREVAMDITLEPGQSIVLIPFTFKAGMECPFLLTVVANGGVKCGRIGGEESVVEVIDSKEPPKKQIEATYVPPDDPGWIGQLKQFGEKTMRATRLASRKAMDSAKKQCKTMQQKSKPMVDSMKKQFKKFKGKFF